MRNLVNAKAGSSMTLVPPTIGVFRNSRAEFLSLVTDSCCSTILTHNERIHILLAL